MKRSENPNADGILRNIDKADKQDTLDEKLKHHQEMLTACRYEDNPLEEANQLGEIGNILIKLEKFEEALHHYGEALTIHREHENRIGEAVDIVYIGNVFYCLGKLDKTRMHYQAALGIHRETDDRLSQALQLWNCLTFLEVKILGQYMKTKGDRVSSST